jgi:serine/threonine protein kinase
MESYGRFEILGRIGRGGMAEILLARERSMAGTSRHLVIKRILPEVADSDEMLHMFLDEARVVMGLSHPNLCQIFEVGERDGTWFIAMEWVHGATLHGLLRRALSDGMDYAIIARIVSQCGEALHHAHTARDSAGAPLNMVHRDVSPHNIMVAYDGRVKLLDFGIAKSAVSTHHTEAGVVKGKVCYMAPEQWLSGPLDGRTDVFALGACLYEALTGRVLFKRDSQMEVMKAVLARDMQPVSELVPEVPPALEAIVHRALAVKPEERFQTALEMAEALEAFISDWRGALGAAQVAEYARRLFPAEVIAGPALERSMYGADMMPPPPMLLPPVPTGLIGPPKPLPRSLTIPPPSFLMHGTRMAPLPLNDESDYPPWTSQVSDPELYDADAPTGPVSVVGRERDRRDDMEEVFGELEPFEGTATFSDIPTRPLVCALSGEEFGRQEGAPTTLEQLVQEAHGLPTRTPSPAQVAAAAPQPPPSALASVSKHEITDPMARPLARTLSIPVRESMRRFASIAFPAAAAAVLAVYGTLTWQDNQANSAAPVHEVQEPAAQVGAVHAQPVAQAQPAAEAAPLANPVTPRVVAPEQASAPVPVRAERADMFPKLNADEGLLSLDTRPWSTVYLDKQLLGTTPLIGVVVPRGALSLRLVDGHGRVHARAIAKADDDTLTRRAFFDFESRSNPDGEEATSARSDSAEAAPVAEQAPAPPAPAPPSALHPAAITETPLDISTGLK